LKNNILHVLWSLWFFVAPLWFFVKQLLHRATQRRHRVSQSNADHSCIFQNVDNLLFIIFLFFSSGLLLIN